MNISQLFLFLFLNFLHLSTQQSINVNIQQNNQYQWYYRQFVKQSNLRMIDQHNSNQSNNFQLRPNNFLYLTNDQFYSTYTTNAKIRPEGPIVSTQVGPTFSQLPQQTSLKGQSLNNTQNNTFTSLVQPQKSLSINIDLTPHATPVKDQGKCNSCFAHSAVATIQTLLHMKFNKFYDLSEQQITDCTTNWVPKQYSKYNNLGCNGGWGWISLYYVQLNGVTHEKNYPYISRRTGKVQTCQQLSIFDEKFKIKDYQYHYNKKNPQSQCHILNEKLLQGKTVATSIWVPKGIQYQFYGSKTQGIDLFDLCGPYDDVNHELQLVGSTDKYWKLKNSYGTAWGQNGFLYLDKSKGLNCLNVCLDFSLPTQLEDSEV